MNNVCMIICHYNDIHLPYAIASLKNQSQKVSIFLIDDGSRPEFKRMFTRFKGIEIEEIPKNKGIGYARDVGLSRALQTGCDFVGFLDSDGIAHPSFVEKAVERLRNERKLLGVAAKKGLANPQVRIAKVKYRYKIYKKDSFQLDCSLFKAKAFSNKRILGRRSGEDSILLQSFKQDELSKLNVPYFHFERESISAFFRDEFYGAYYGYKGNMAKTFFQILITPHTSLKMVIRNHWFLEGLLFPVRQFVWFFGFLLGVKSER
jgi:glycosyltransferase involved in cell wall biosynthesis